ncbi:MAG: ferredoxin [Anaerolineaceae bacterium]|nr:ferredoxin [Anaerolineaceae bacterium]
MNKKISRREALRIMALTSTAFLVSCAERAKKLLPTPSLISSQTPIQTSTLTINPTEVSHDKPSIEIDTEKDINRANVYLTKTVSSDGLLRIYEAIGRKAFGKVAIKIHSGEPGGHYFLQPDFISSLVNEVKGTFVECNTAYGGRRSTTDSHLVVMEEHGFTSIAPVDIMDADGTMSIPVVGGKHLKEVIVGSHLSNYDFVVNLAHFKGHMMGGFGGVLKNMAIGMAASVGKSLVHSAGTQTTGFGMGTPQDDFLESMAEAAKGIADYMKGNMIFIDVMKNLSVDCDCMSNPAAPTMADIGILASLDPVALDQACVDLIYAASDSKNVIERIESRNGIHILEHAETIGFGSRQYELVSID